MTQMTQPPSNAEQTVRLQRAHKSLRLKGSSSPPVAAAQQSGIQKRMKATGRVGRNQRSQDANDEAPPCKAGESRQQAHL